MGAIIVEGPPLGREGTNPHRNEGNEKNEGQRKDQVIEENRRPSGNCQRKITQKQTPLVEWLIAHVDHRDLHPFFAKSLGQRRKHRNREIEKQTRNEDNKR